MQHKMCVCDKNTTQDVVVIKIQHTISGSESRNVTQIIVMQFWNVVYATLLAKPKMNTLL